MNPTAAMKNYVAVHGGHNRKPPGHELDAFVVDINGQPPSTTFCDALQPEGWSIHRVTHAKVLYASNCTYVAGTALRFFLIPQLKIATTFCMNRLRLSRCLHSASAILQ